MIRYLLNALTSNIKMHIIQYMQKEDFRKEEAKSPSTASTELNNSSINFSFESVFFLMEYQEILKKDFTEIETFPQSELIDLIRKSIAEYSYYIVLSKGDFEG